MIYIALLSLVIVLIMLMNFKIELAEEKARQAYANSLKATAKASQIESIIREQEETKGNEFTAYRKIRKVIYPDRKIEIDN